MSIETLGVVTDFPGEFPIRVLISYIHLRLTTNSSNGACRTVQSKMYEMQSGILHTRCIHETEDNTSYMKV